MKGKSTREVLVPAFLLPEPHKAAEGRLHVRTISDLKPSPEQMASSQCCRVHRCTSLALCCCTHYSTFAMASHDGDVHIEMKVDEGLMMALPATESGMPKQGLVTCVKRDHRGEEAHVVISDLKNVKIKIPWAQAQQYLISKGPSASQWLSLSPIVPARLPCNPCLL